jgi:hypothetical protein
MKLNETITHSPLKFRVINKNKKKKTGHTLIFVLDQLLGIEPFVKIPNPQDYDISQWTGYTDSNGVELYGGDIVNLKIYSHTGQLRYGLILFNNNQWIIRDFIFPDLSQPVTQWLLNEDKFKLYMLYAGNIYRLNNLPDEIKKLIKKKYKL